MRSYERLSKKTTSITVGALTFALTACSASNVGSSFPSGAHVSAGRSLVPTAGSGRLESGGDTILHSFISGSDGADPHAGLIIVGGTLYGTTTNGGGTGCDGFGCGTVFKITESGETTVLHRFAGGSDGGSPDAGLRHVDNALYGTTFLGGTQDAGTLFKVTAAGKESVLYNFMGGADGGLPVASLIDSGGKLFGTSIDGASGNGNVFEATTSGKENGLYSFTGGNDGADPQSPLTDVGGTFYGTTVTGGSAGDGTVFEISSSGDERVIHNFTGYPDGEEPLSGLLNVNGTLYGTTALGGKYSNGMVFKITPSGKESALYSFSFAGTDGADPQASLIDRGGSLYGTTTSGGTSSNCPGGCGTVFKITKTGSESVLHSFTGGADGADPKAPLLAVGDTLYGTTTTGGGSTNCSGGCGIVFSIPL